MQPQEPQGRCDIIRQPDDGVPRLKALRTRTGPNQSFWSVRSSTHDVLRTAHSFAPTQVQVRLSDNRRPRHPAHSCALSPGARQGLGTTRPHLPRPLVAQCAASAHPSGSPDVTAISPLCECVLRPWFAGSRTSPAETRSSADFCNVILGRIRPSGGSARCPAGPAGKS